MYTLALTNAALYASGNKKGAKRRLKQDVKLSIYLSQLN